MFFHQSLDAAEAEKEELGVDKAPAMGKRTRAAGGKPASSQTTSHVETWFSAVNLIPFADEISKTVKAFGAARGLNYFHRDQRDLTWVLSEGQAGAAAGSRIRRLQIVAYVQEDQPHLSIVPMIQEVLGLERMLVPRHSLAERFPATQVSTSGQFDARKFRARLATTWQKTAGLELIRAEMVEVAVGS